MNVFANIFNKKEFPQECLNMLPDAVLIISSSGEIFQSNEQAQTLFGMSEYELRNNNIDKLIEGAILVIDTALSTGKVQVGKAIVDDKKLIYLEINAKMNTFSDSSKIAVIIRDVTDTYIQTAEIFAELEKYKNSNTDKNGFLVNLSNELQAPLHSAVGFSRALLENLGGMLNEKQQKYISIINKNTSELLSMLGKIVTLSKFEADTININYKNFDLVEFINTNLNLFKKDISLKNINFSLGYEDLITRNCYIDETLLKTLFNNIVEAFVKNIPSGNLSVTISNPSEATLDEYKLPHTKNFDEKSYVMLCFLTDNFAIPQNEFELIMNPYKQAVRDNKKYLETALAFSISRCIVEFLDGSICIEQRGIQGAVAEVIIKLDKTEIANE